MGVVQKKCDDFSGTPPSYVDFEDLVDALDAVRRANVHGHGYDEPVAKDDDSSDSDSDDDDPKTCPWLNEPFEDEDGIPLGTGSGFVLPFVLEGKDARVTVGGDPTGPRRTSPESATLNALAVALAGGRSDQRGTFHPLTHARLLGADALDDWFAAGDDAPDEAAVAVLPKVNLGVQIDPALVRRGDLVVVEWDPEGKHAYFCWDAHVHGDQVWLQLASSHAQTAGVGVLLRLSSAAREGKLERVRRLGTVFRTPVHRTDAKKPWLGTRAARVFYRRHGHWFRSPARDGDPGGHVKTAWAGRFHRSFPRYPIALGGEDEVSGISRSLAATADDAAVARSRKASAELYFTNNERSPGGEPRPGGFFPIGASSTWHGGIHLYPEKDDLVRAPVDGVLLAARLTTDTNQGPSGDAGFVLVRTKLSIDGQETTFFTLLVHLRAPDPRKDDVPWLDAVLGAPPDDDPGWDAMLDPAKDWARVLAPLPPDPGNPDAEDRTGADADDGSLLVFEKRDRSLDQKGQVATGTIVEVTTGLDAHGWAKIKTQDGSVEGFAFAESRLEDVDPQDYDKKLRDKRRSLLAGETVDLTDLDAPLVVRSGEIMGQVGQIAGDAALHVEVFSADLVPVDGKAKPDVDASDDSLHFDRASFEEKFYELVEQARSQAGGSKDAPPLHHYMIASTRQDDDQVHAEEIRDFFARSPLRVELRSFVTRHKSTWGDQLDWKTAMGSKKLDHLSGAAKQAFVEEVGRLQWWKGGFLQGAGLPADQVVHHYHPIHFLAWLDEKREGDSDGSLHASVFDMNHGPKS